MERLRKIDLLNRKQLVTIGKKLKIDNYKTNFSKPYLRKEDLKKIIVQHLQNNKNNINLVTHVDKKFKSNLSKKRNIIKKESQILETSSNYDNFIFPKVEKLVAIGDIHGDLPVAIKALKLAGVINKNIPNDTKNIEEIHWIGDKTHVVQLGDQIDRVRPGVLINNICPDNDPELVEDEGSDLKIICLFNRLHSQAKRVGGACLSILGNHELMNVDGDFRYVSPKEFREFGNFFKASKSLKNTKFPYGYFERKRAFECGGIIAKKLAETRFSTVQVGSWIFVHGGLTPKMANMYSIKDINYNIRNWLIGCKKTETLKAVNDIYHTDDDDNSPFWSRVFSDGEEWDENISEKEFNKTINILNTKNNRNDDTKIKGMILGHSPQFMYNKGVNSDCNNKLWRVDVGMSRAFGEIKCSNPDYENRKVQILVIKNDDQFFIIKEK
jgi:hypothetical protein